MNVFSPSSKLHLREVGGPSQDKYTKNKKYITHKTETPEASKVKPENLLMFGVKQHSSTFF